MGISNARRETGSVIQSLVQRHVQRQQFQEFSVAPAIATNRYGAPTLRRGSCAAELGALAELDWSDREPLPGFSLADGDVS